MNKLPIDLIQYCIFDKLDFKTQIRFRQICKRLNRIDIHNIHFYVNYKYLRNLSDKVFINYPKVKYFNALGNPKMTNINHMTNLQILDASYNCGLDDNGIKDLNLIELDVSDNPKITNVNHMTNLQILNASFNCGIDDNGIKNLNLIELNASDNPKITNINHMTNLKILDASRNCGINHNNIKNLNLIEIYIYNNQKIKINNLRHINSLQCINACKMVALTAII